MKKNYIDPYDTNDYFLGGLVSALSGVTNKIGSGLANSKLGQKFRDSKLGQSGVGKFMASAALGHTGAGRAFTKANKNITAEEAAMQEQQMQEQQFMQSQYNAQSGMDKVGAYNQNLNNLSNPNDFKYGGMSNDNGGTNLINPTDVNYFGEGGSHEGNPHGGIPQGQGSNGKMNTVEEGEVSIRLDKDTQYIFSDRLTYV